MNLIQGKCSWKLDTYLPELFAHCLHKDRTRSYWKGWPANFGIFWSCIGVFDCGPVAVCGSTKLQSQQPLPRWWSCGSNNSVCRTEWITTKCIHCTRQCRQNPRQFNIHVKYANECSAVAVLVLIAFGYCYKLPHKRDYVAEFMARVIPLLLNMLRHPQLDLYICNSQF